MLSTEKLYTREELESPSVKIAELKELGKQMSLYPSGNRSARQTWVNAILEDQEEHGAFRLVKSEDLKPGDIVHQWGEYHRVESLGTREDGRIYPVLTVLAGVDHDQANNAWMPHTWRVPIEPPCLLQESGPWKVGQRLWQPLYQRIGTLTHIQELQGNLFVWVVRDDNPTTSGRLRMEQFQREYVPYAGQDQEGGRFEIKGECKVGTLSGHLMYNDRDLDLSHYAPGHYLCLDITQRRSGATWQAPRLKLREFQAEELAIARQLLEQAQAVVDLMLKHPVNKDLADALNDLLF